MADESVAMYVRKDLTGTDELTLASSDIDSVDTVRDNNNRFPLSSQLLSNRRRKNN